MSIMTNNSSYMQSLLIFVMLECNIQEMQSYKLVLVLRSTLSDTDRKKFFETVKGWLKDHKIIREDEWGQKSLSYSIKKEANGFYVEMAFEGEAVVPSDFEKKLKTSDNVLRHLLLKN